MVNKFLPVLLCSIGVLYGQSASFPSNVASSSTLLKSNAFFQANLSTAISNSTTIIPIKNTQFTLTYPTVVRIDAEFIKVCSGTSSALTVCTSGRGFDSTIASSHLVESLVDVSNVPSFYHNILAAELIAVENALGANLYNVQSRTLLYDTSYNTVSDLIADAIALHKPAVITRNATIGTIHIASPVTIYCQGSATLTTSGLLSGNAGFSFDPGSDGSAIYGAGYNSVLTRANGALNNTFIVLLNASNIKIQSIHFIGNGENTTSGEHAAAIFGDYRASGSNISDNWFDSSQGDGINFTTSNFGCSGININKNHFLNMGRSFIVIAGYGCNKVHVTDNDFDYGSLISTSSSHGSAVDFEPDYTSGTSENSIVSNNTFKTYKGFLAYSYISSGFQDIGNTGTMQHTSGNLGSCHILVSVISAIISNNQCTAAGGSGSGEVGIYIYDVTPGTTKNISVKDNVMDGMTGPCYLEYITPGSGIPTGTQTVFHHNIGKNCGAGGLKIGGSGFGASQDLTVERNEMYNITGDAYHIEGTTRFNLAGNIATQYTVNGMYLACNVNFPAFGYGDIFNNTLQNTTIATQTGLRIDNGSCSSGGPLVRIKENVMYKNQNPHFLGVPASYLSWATSNIFGTASPYSYICIRWVGNCYAGSNRK